MPFQTLAVWVVVGAAMGLAGAIVVKDEGFGLVGDTSIGVAGAILGGVLLPLVGIDFGAGVLAATVSAMTGTFILVSIARLVQRI